MARTDQQASVIKRHSCRLCACIGLVVIAVPGLATVPNAESIDARPAVSNRPAEEAMSESPPAPPVRKTVRYVWRISDGDKISDAFRAWARQARQWQVSWEAPELVAQATVDLDGNFEDAVTKVVEALNRNDANLLARFYIDKGNNVLRVMEKK